MVISGRGFNKCTVGSVKRIFEQLMDVSSEKSVTLDKVKRRSIPIEFYIEELPGAAPNTSIPLLVRACLANFDVKRILVDQGSSIDIIYSQLFTILQLNETHLTPYVYSDLQGFNGSVTNLRDMSS